MIVSMDDYTITTDLGSKWLVRAKCVICNGEFIGQKGLLTPEIVAGVQSILCKVAQSAHSRPKCNKKAPSGAF